MDVQTTEVATLGTSGKRSGLYRKDTELTPLEPEIGPALNEVLLVPDDEYFASSNLCNWLDFKLLQSFKEDTTYLQS